jgi:hypothetical protein
LHYYFDIRYLSPDYFILFLFSAEFSELRLQWKSFFFKKAKECNGIASPIRLSASGAGHRSFSEAK